MDPQLISQTIVRFPRFADQPIAVAPLEKGGSDRKFYRVQVGSSSSLILVKYGDQREENRHYVCIARFLHEIGVRVPEIYFHDENEGLIWMEDLGERDLWCYRNDPWPVRRDLYQRTLQQVLALHTKAHLAHAVAKTAPRLQVEFNAELYRWEQNYFLEHCLGNYFKLSQAEIAEHCEEERLTQIADLLGALPRVFVHRDFQSQNIVVKEGEACLIDFQGMRPGLVQYDLASLLYDPYVTLSTGERDELLAWYLEQWKGMGGEPADDFRAIYDLCAMQRLMQALGAYGFLGLVKQRDDFLVHIPVALKSLGEVVNRIPGLEKLHALLADLQRVQAAA